MVSWWRSILARVVAGLVGLAMLCCAPFGPQAHAGLGDTIINIAELSYRAGDERVGPFETNAATLTVQAAVTPSTIEFLRIAPNAEAGVLAALNGSDYSPSGAGGDFVAIDVASVVAGAAVRLSPASTYFSGEVMVVRVIDAGQNGDPDAVETVEVTVRSESGDTLRLRLYESGPDTGEFYAYLPSTPDASPENDPVLTAPRDDSLTATYIDRFDATEISVDTALVDPFGRLFDSTTGALIDGATVSIVDAATGAPAEVFGIDGVSPYPSTLVTGGSVTDASGLVYDLDPGEFLFPLMAPGDYRLLITPPGRYSFPSAADPQDFAGLSNGPFEIIAGSFGGVFTVEDTGPLNFDVPLDPDTAILLRKSAQRNSASIGDFVPYSLIIENQGVSAVRVFVQDILPLGFRYQAGTARLDGAVIADPEIAADGRTLSFDAGRVSPGENASVTYVAGIGAGARDGEAINRAVVLNPGGFELSNVAEAVVRVEEDFLRSHLTIIGRVAERACDGDEDWARELRDGEGVAGVRLYMEDGRYVVTDEDGLYHFEDVERGTHVVQVDTETLPEGYEVMRCEDNSRYAGSPTSKFVEATGGTLWRANFYLKQVREVEAKAEERLFDEATEYGGFGFDWLEAQDGSPSWVYPSPDRTPDMPSIDIGIKHGKQQTIELRQNGKTVPAFNLQGTDKASNNVSELTRWRGVDLFEGENRFEAVVRDEAGGVVATLQESIWFVTKAEAARLAPDQSRLTADGRTQPIIAVRIEDRTGRAVHAGRIVSARVADPYRMASDTDFERRAPLTARTGSGAPVSVDPDGLARIALDPTLVTGRVRISVELDNGASEDIDVYLTPEERDWVVVGVATAYAGFEKNQGPPDSSLRPVASNRVALFAKGMVRGDWLLTVALDTAKRRGREDDELFDRIDPNAYYTLYGDRTNQFNEAESRYPLYIKLEKDTAQLLFGDFETGLDETQLGQYSRRLSGVRGVYESERVSATGFASETNQGFIKDEIAADGTSGPYRLTRARITRNSERIVVETRDRVRADEVLARQTLQRYADYDLDYTTGELIFRAPVDAVDAGFNPRVIVVDYEVPENGERAVTAGGRAAIRPYADEKLEAGVTYIREEEARTRDGGPSELIAVDVTAELSETLRLRAEAASTRSDGVDEAQIGGGDAYAVEILHQSLTSKGRAYVREEQAGFGLGQQGSNTRGLRRYGADLTARIWDDQGTSGGLGVQRFVDAEAYKEEDLTGDASRTVAAAALRQESALLDAAAGLRHVDEQYPDGDDRAGRQSVLLTGQVGKTFPDMGLTVSATHEEPVFQSDDQSTAFPQRTVLGADKTLGRHAAVSVRHQTTNGADASGQNTTVGLTVRPWEGGQVRLASDVVTQDSARRIGATVGVDQSVQLSKAWSASVGTAHRARIDGSDDPRDPFADDAISPLADGVRSPYAAEEGYTSAYVGAGYRTERTAASARFEARLSELGDRYVLTGGAAREVTERLSFAAGGLVQYDGQDGGDTRNAELRIGAAWRPRGEGPTVYNRLDLQHQESFAQGSSWKAVNNVGANVMLTRRTQAAVYHGVKYVEAEFEGARVNGLTNLIGGEVRHDITERVDVGLAASLLTNNAARTSEVAWGPSVGVTPVKNVWLGAGYNFEGFDDRDFEEADTSRDGFYVKLRVKFDQDTVKDLLQKVSPGGR